MKHPWVNILILAFVTVEFISGFWGLVSGSRDEAVFIIIHRIAGYGLVVLMVWKVAIILFALRNRKRGRMERTASLVLFGLLMVTLALGFAWSAAGPYYYRPPSGITWSGVSWHIYVSVLLIPLVVSHAIAYIRSFPLPLTFWVERRAFLRFAGIALAGLVFWQTGEQAVRAMGLSGKDRRFTGSYGATSINGEFPVVSWLNDVPPQTEIDSWRLSVHGLVKRDLSLGYSDLTSNDEMTATIDCTGGWHSEQVWRGVPLARLLDEAELLPEARSVKVTSATGYYRRFTIAEAREYLLATHVGDRLLPRGHGYPVRLAARGKRGFEWVKWVTDIEIDNRPKWLQPPLPIQ